MVDARTASRLAWGLWIATILLGVAAVAFLIASRSTPFPPGSFGFRGFALLFGFSFATPGAMVAARKPGNPIGWIFLAMGVASSVQELAHQYAIWAILHEGGGYPLERVAAWIPAWIWIPATSGAMFLLLLFPDGRLLSPRWRWIAVFGSVGIGLATVGFAVNAGPLQNFRVIDNPFGIGPVDAAQPAAILGQTLYGVGIIASAVALVRRFRRSSGEERRQLTWLVTAGLFLALSLTSSFPIAVISGPNAEVPGPVALVVILAFCSLPIATGIAILRFRLYDIDLVIKKTLIYAVLAALLFAVGIPFTWALGGIAIAIVGESEKAYGFALAGIVFGVLIWPLRRMATRIADRLVFGRRATPYQVLTEFSDRVAGTYAAEDVLERMAHVLAEGVGAGSATVWLRGREGFHPGATWPRGARADEEVPPGAIEVRHRDEVLGALSVRMPANDPMTPAKEGLIRDLASQAGLVLRNAKLIEDLKASRQRLVAAQDEERRRIERNIHDGAQQQLVALAVKLGLTERTLRSDPDRAETMLAEAKAETNDALETLRDLARGIYPPLLADEGLAAALTAQARKAPMPVSIETDGIGRYVQEAEAAVYFSCLEALQNVAKHAGASSATIRLEEAAGELTFEVRDDGRGFDPAVVGHGTGLQGIADRLAALGGELSVRSAPGDGTAVAGRLPIEADA